MRTLAAPKKRQSQRPRLVMARDGRPSVPGGGTRHRLLKLLRFGEMPPESGQGFGRESAKSRVHAMSSSDDRALRSEAMVVWREIAELGIAA